MVILSECPLCGNSLLKPFLQSKDFFLTGREFSILFCEKCGFKFTSPRPELNEQAFYYASEQYLSHSSRKTNLKSFLYRAVRNFNIRTKYNIVQNNSIGTRILDFGCGTGEFLAFCRKKKMNVTGVEPNEKAREFGKKFHQLEILDISELDEKKLAGFDIITLWHVLEHVPDLHDRMNKIRRLMNTGGTLIIAVPNSDSWDAEYYRQYWAAYDLPRHLYHFNKETFRLLASDHGFKIEKIIPLKWDAYYISLLSEKYKKGFSNYPGAFFHGARSNFYARKKNGNYSSVIFVLNIAN